MKPLTQTEMKHLIYLHIKRDHLTYDEAKAMLERLVRETQINHKKSLEEKKEQKKIEEKDFKKNFQELKNAK